ncbi:ribonuclease H2 subunit C isoform X2 [Ptiloglossa arizonensis]|uniref:ribonuclease H2 subunit C isoform X2 n=1 Tax=Ptiloglossa arizonensis TaxID=3350558 RepID=UPI003FA08008
MAIRLHMKHDLSEAKENILHLMPCKIHGDESANVSSYFTPYIRKIDDEHYNSSFRGYPLQGKKITIPSGYKGTFSYFTYWNYDKLPSKNDALVAAIDWIDIAEALHSTES